MTVGRVEDQIAPKATNLSADPGIRTPRAWRAASLILLAGGVFAGNAAASRIRTRAAVRLGALFGVGLFTAVGWWSRRPPMPAAPSEFARPASETSLRLKGGAPRRPTFSVLIAARNEAAVLPALLSDLARQDYRDASGQPQFDVIVVDDQSDDGTPGLVEDATRTLEADVSVRLVRRRGDHLPDGKGAALAALGPVDCRGDVIVVLDADARVEPGYLRTLAWYAEQGVLALTGRIRITPGRGWLARAQADEQALDGAIQRARWASGGCAEFRGNGIVVDRGALLAAGGWRPVLTEDLDLSARLAVRGTRVAWAGDAVVWAQPVTTIRALWRQRIRWAEGSIRRAMEHGGPVVRSGSIPAFARLEFALYVGQLLVPLAFIGAVAAGLRGCRWVLAFTIVASYATAFTLMTADALGSEPAPGGASWAIRLARGLRVALFSGIWLAAVPVALGRLALRRGPVLYARTEHRASDSSANGAWNVLPTGPRAPVRRPASIASIRPRRVTPVSASNGS